MKSKLLTLRIIHVSILIFCAFTIGLSYLSKQVNPENHIISYIGLMLGVAIIPFSYMIPKILGKSAQTNPEITNKFSQYYTAKIVQWAMVEGIIIINGVAHYLSGLELSVGMGGLLICYLGLIFPNISEFQKIFEIPNNILQGTKYYLN